MNDYCQRQMMKNNAHIIDNVERAIELRDRGQSAAAETICRQQIARKPRHAAALHLMGIICNETGRAPEALEFLVRSVEAEPCNPLFRSNLAAALGLAGRLNEAVAELRK